MEIDRIGSHRQYVSFDLSLARGLTYYTGLIYECVVLDGGLKVCVYVCVCMSYVFAGVGVGAGVWPSLLRGGWGLCVLV